MKNLCHTHPTLPTLIYVPPALRAGSRTHTQTANHRPPTRIDPHREPPALLNNPTTQPPNPNENHRPPTRIDPHREPPAHLNNPTTQPPNHNENHRPLTRIDPHREPPALLMNELRHHIKALHADAFRWAMHQAGDRQLAEDALQAAYEALLDGSAACRDPEAFKSFLFGLVRNKVRALRRRQTFSRFAALDFKALQKTPTSSLETDHADPRVAALRQALLTLSPRQRDLMELVFYHELTLDEAARTLGINPGTARTHYDRAKRALRTHLNALEDACLTNPTR
ncbi:sigma-70 family RNA polymerase sigma factor [Lujinxingia sediminis]|uniref:Sigma-70 family RNA polymerase sigma factor n=2 Tax=Lujinxingia sediminis TaxID=2480984 RepID=A0ABY0CSF3_9DELT|nr:sigma-70 family RNA polymerase sigma factor [Lujinxingia sediminis]